MNNRLLLRRMGGVTPPSIFQDATVAYSLRDLGLGATNLIRVRRSSDDAEQDFTATEITDGTLTTFVGAGNDGFVTTWYDQKGTANALQSTASSQPKIVNAGSLILESGKPAIDFDGVDDYLTTTQTFSLTETSVFTVCKYDFSVAEAYPVLVQSTNNTGFRQHLNDTFARGRFSGTNIDDNLARPDNIYSLFTIINDGANGYVYLQGVEVATGSAPLSADPTANLSLTTNPSIRSDYGNGIMQEAILYDTEQLSNRVNLEDNINNYYTIY